MKMFFPASKWKIILPFMMLFCYRGSCHGERDKKIKQEGTNTPYSSSRIEDCSLDKFAETDLISPMVFEPIEVKATDTIYHGEKHNNITFDLTFETKPVCPLKNVYLIIHCLLILKHTLLYKYVVQDGVEVSESQDEQFSGRVQSDKDVLREGRIRLHVSRLRAEDSGEYACTLKIGCCLGKGKFTLNVTEPLSSVPQSTTVSPPTENQGMIGLYSIVFSLLLIVLFSCIIYACVRKNQHESSERQPLCIFAANEIL